LPSRRGTRSALKKEDYDGDHFYVADHYQKWLLFQLIPGC
jgi:hypothetical protein